MEMFNFNNERNEDGERLAIMILEPSRLEKLSQKML